MPVVVGGGPTRFTAGVQASLLPWGDYGSDWQNLNAAYASMFEAVYSIVADQGSPDEPATYTAGWSTLLDPTQCPTAYLPYLSMFNGTGVQPNTPDAVARSIIEAEAGFQRGTPGAIRNAVVTNLTRTQSCVILERTAGNGTPDPYGFVIIVRPEEVTSVTALQAAVDAIRPAGLVWTLILTDAWTWNQAVHVFNADTFSWNASASTQP